MMITCYRFFLMVIAFLCISITTVCDVMSNLCERWAYRLEARCDALALRTPRQNTWR